MALRSTKTRARAAKYAAENAVVFDKQLAELHKKFAAARRLDDPGQRYLAFETLGEFLIPDALACAEAVVDRQVDAVRLKGFWATLFRTDETVVDESLRRVSDGLGRFNSDVAELRRLLWRDQNHILRNDLPAVAASPQFDRLYDEVPAVRQAFLKAAARAAAEFAAAVTPAPEVLPAGPAKAPVIFSAP